MRETMVGRIEIAPVVPLGLIAGVEQHRVHAVVVGEREVQHLELDGHMAGRTVGLNRDGAAVESRGSLSSNVDLDPNRLILVGADGDGQAATA